MSDKLTVPDVLPLARSYVAKEGNKVGGSLHLVLKDYNVDTDSINFCLNHSIEVSDEDGAVLSRKLLLMTKTQRLKVARQCWVASPEIV